MFCVILTCLLALTTALPSHPIPYKPHVPILQDDRINPDGSGNYAFEVKTGDGISRSELGAPIYEAHGAVGQQGSVSFTFPNGEPFHLDFVSDQGGYQPKSSWIPVQAPFPHPLPKYVLDQIEKAKLEHAQGITYDAPAPVSQYTDH